DSTLQRRDVRQMMPKLPVVRENAAAKAGSGSESGELFPVSSEPAKIFSRIADWAETFHPARPEPLALSPSAVNGYRTCPQQYLFTAEGLRDRKSTRLNSSHRTISYAVFCLKKKKITPKLISHTLLCPIYVVIPSLLL